MALPYPEGEVFFKRSVLRDNGNGLEPDNLTSFNSHALIEWCWNESYGQSYQRSYSKHQQGKHDERESYTFNNAMIIMFGSKEGFEKKVGRGDGDWRHDSRHSGIERMVKTMLPDGSEEYERRAKGGPLMTALTPIKLHPDEPYMYIDLTFPIRAVYFPLAQKPSQTFPDLCSYLMVDFRLRQGVRMWDEVPIAQNNKLEEKYSNPDEWESDEIGAEADTEADAKANAEFMKFFGPKQRDEKPGVRMDFDLYAGLGCRPDCKSTSLSGPYPFRFLSPERFTAYTS
jgi:hypothetical protein